MKSASSSFRDGRGRGGSRDRRVDGQGWRAGTRGRCARGRHDRQGNRRDPLAGRRARLGIGWEVGQKAAGEPMLEHTAVAQGEMVRDRRPVPRIPMRNVWAVGDVTDGGAVHGQVKLLEPEAGDPRAPADGDEIVVGGNACFAGGDHGGAEASVRKRGPSRPSASPILRSSRSACHRTRRSPAGTE